MSWSVDADVGVERCAWDNQPDSYWLVGTFEAPGLGRSKEEWGLASLASQARGERVPLRSRSDVTDDVVRDAAREALGLYCEGRCDPDEVEVSDLRVEERRTSRRVELG
jgi:hypothetical protein